MDMILWHQLCCGPGKPSILSWRIRAGVSLTGRQQIYVRSASQSLICKFAILVCHISIPQILGAIVRGLSSTDLLLSTPMANGRFSSLITIAWLIAIVSASNSSIPLQEKPSTKSASGDVVTTEKAAAQNGTLDNVAIASTVATPGFIVAISRKRE